MSTPPPTSDADNWASLNIFLAALSSKVDALQAAASTPHTPPSSSSPVTAPSANLVAPQYSMSIPRASYPDRFKGERSRARGFINQLELVFKITPTSDDVKIAIVGILLSGHALAWYNPYLEKPDHYQTFLNSWTNFRALFLETFGDADAAQVVSHKIRNLSQGSKSVSVYCAAFRVLQSDLEWNDHAFCAQFLYGLNDKISNMMLFADDPKTLDEAVTLAI